MKKKHILPLLLIIQIFAIKILGHFPGIVEKYYSSGLYLTISKILRILIGWIPFSFGDVVYTALVLVILKWFYKKRKTWKTAWKENLLKSCSFISALYFTFHFFWAFNYYRQPINIALDIGREYTLKELQDLTLRLITKTNAIQREITRDTALKVIFPYSRDAIYSKSLNGYSQLAITHRQFTYTNPSIKGSLYSLPLTYMGFSGYLNPFTGEAQVNDKMPLYQFPVTVCHEMAHQLGYASESEANFIGFLSSKSNTDIYFQYAAYSFALRYCLNTLEKAQPGSISKLHPLINKGILENYKDSREFWAQYESFVETGFKLFYDRYLKMNQQKDGLEGYSRFVELLVNYYKNKSL
ncbi:DUF3810 domain-containing protein [Flavobacterium sp.]|uniref:DUF3810 domain-containing protein n=1 Tax=Flavobacterium sp. TaxID=239 RepID=UPI002633A16E|nr:DUF3810 domain-containing protein [Flavobacterium sp.]